MSGFGNSSTGRPGFCKPKRNAARQAAADHDGCGGFAVFMAENGWFSRDPKGSALPERSPSGRG
jgi:hypothetical protein